MYSEENQPVRVTATTTNGQFELVVCNKGNPIPSAAMDHLFQPSQGARFGQVSKV